MKGYLPSQEEVKLLNGWQYAIGVDADPEADYYVLQCLVEKVKGGGKFGASDYTTWEIVGTKFASLDQKRPNDGAQTVADVQAWLDTITPLLNAKVGLGGSSANPPFPTAATYLDQVKWLAKYGIQLNQSTGKFTASKG